jgi:hypothetical protein
MFHGLDEVVGVGAARLFDRLGQHDGVDVA